jgi:CzcA family heavy metal efflux pump
MNSIIGWSLSFRMLVVGLAVALLVLGGLQLRDTPIDVLPEYTAPYVEIQTEALGLSAAEVEQFVTVPMEALMLNGVAFVDTVRSESVPGLSSIVLIFEPGTDLYRARQMVQERMSHATLIPRVSKPPQMIQPLSSASRVMIVSLASAVMSPTDLSVLARWTIRPRLMGVEGVANVAIWGHRERQLQVLVDPQRLHGSGVTLDQVISTTGNALWVSPLSYLRASTPGAGGFIDTPNQRIGIRHVLPIRTPEDLSRIPIDGHPNLRIGDVAQVVEDHQPMIGDASTAEGQSLMLIIEKLPGEHSLDVTRRVESAMTAMQPGLPGVTVDTTVYRAATFIESAMANLALVLGIALLLIAAVIGAFLLQWRAVVIAIVAITMSILTAALVLHVLGATINALVVAGLVVALAVIVDDVIVDIDNALRRLRERTPDAFERPVKDVLRTAFLEVRGASVSATLVVLLVLVPVVAMGGVLGAFLQPFALAFVVATIASLFVGLTITPALASLLLRETRIERPEPVLIRTLHAWHQRLLARVLARPAAGYAAVVLVALIAILAIPQLGTSLAPTFRERDMLIQVDAAPGTSQPAMNRIVEQASVELRAIPGIRRVGSHVGRAILSDQVVNIRSGQIWLSMDPAADYDATIGAVRSVIAGYPGLALSADTYLSDRASDIDPTATAPVAVRIFGPDLAELGNQADAVRAAIADIPGISSPRIQTTAMEPTVEVEVDLDAAARHGVKPGDVRRAAATLISGLEVGNLFEDQKVFEVIVVGVPEMRHSLTSLEELLIDTTSGDQVALKDLASVRIAPSPVSIEREGISRYVDVVADVEGRDVGAVLADVRDALSGRTFPMEYHPEVSTAYTDAQADLQRLLGVMIAVAIIGFLILQALFESWRLAAVSMVILPVTLGGGIVAAYLTGSLLTLGSFVGFLAVLAIAARNEVALVERLRSLERHGTPPGPSLVLRGTRERMGPMVMTALAASLACLAIIVLGDRPGLELLRPMAIVLVGGLITSTLLNLFIFPTLYLDLTAQRAAGTMDVTLPKVAESQPAGVQ